MGTWIKIFKDGSVEHGSDKDILKRKASWSKGKLTDIESVKIFENNLCGSMIIPNTEWHQYDRYMASLLSFKDSNQQSCRTARVIQAKVKQEHVGKYINHKYMSGMLFVNLGNKANNDNILITKNHIDLWITLYLLCNGQTGIVICEKGAFSGDNQILR